MTMDYVSRKKNEMRINLCGLTQIKCEWNLRENDVHYITENAIM